MDLPPAQRSYDCLASGTPVVTLTGLHPVDTLQVGDMVLSQHPDTGQLAYQAVLETTIRPRGETLRVE